MIGINALLTPSSSYVISAGVSSSFNSTGNSPSSRYNESTSWRSVGVIVGVGVTVSVGVLVGVGVTVSVGVIVGVGVGVSVGVLVGVETISSDRNSSSFFFRHQMFDHLFRFALLPLPYLNFFPIHLKPFH